MRLLPDCQMALTDDLTICVSLAKRAYHTYAISTARGIVLRLGGGGRLHRGCRDYHGTDVFPRRVYGAIRANVRLGAGRDCTCEPLRLAYVRPGIVRFWGALRPHWHPLRGHDWWHDVRIG